MRCKLAVLMSFLPTLASPQEPDPDIFLASLAKSGGKMTVSAATALVTAPPGLLTTTL